MRSAQEEQERLEKLIAPERTLRRAGLIVAGIDEVGRGPLAGPVVAACVALPEEPLIEHINDSKKLSPKRRAQAYERIMAAALLVGVGQATEREIDEINILQATRLAMKRAVEGMRAAPGHLLIDGRMALDSDMPQTALIHGDALCYSIAAASIVAKVFRDRIMAAYEDVYPGYGFAQHKGYGTAAHIRAIRALGPTPIHRRGFLGGILA